MMARAIAPTGALFTFIALWTGALWGRPTWGTYWVWDARLTSELILLFLYVGFIALQASIEDPRRADRAGAVLAIVGAINVPIIYFSVQWWNTLHQGASVSLTRAPTMAAVMLQGMLLMVVRLLVLRDRGDPDAGARDHSRTRARHGVGGGAIATAGRHELGQPRGLPAHGRIRPLRLGILRRDGAPARGRGAYALRARRRTIMQRARSDPADFRTQRQ